MVNRTREQNGVRYDPEVLAALRNSAMVGQRTLTDEVNRRLRQSLEQYPTLPPPLTEADISVWVPGAPVGELGAWAGRHGKTMTWLANELGVSSGSLAAWDRDDWGEDAEEKRANVWASLRAIEERELDLAEDSMPKRQVSHAFAAVFSGTARIPPAHISAVWQLAEATTPAEINAAYDAICVAQGFKPGDQARVSIGKDRPEFGPVGVVDWVGTASITLRFSDSEFHTYSAEEVVRAEWIGDRSW